MTVTPLRQLRSPNVTVTVVMVVVGTAVTKVVTVSDMMVPVTVVVTENMAVVVVVVASATNTTAVPVTVVVAEVVPATEIMVAVMVAEVVAVAEMMMAVVVVVVGRATVWPWWWRWPRSQLISQALSPPTNCSPRSPTTSPRGEGAPCPAVGRALLAAVLRTRIASTITQQTRIARRATL